MQNGTFKNYEYPQIRILTHKIKPQDGYDVIANSTLSHQELLELEHQATLHIQAALTSYRITV